MKRDDKIKIDTYITLHKRISRKSSMIFPQDY